MLSFYYFCDSAIKGDDLYSIGTVKDVGLPCSILAVSSTVHCGSASNSLSRLHADGIELRLCDNDWSSFDDLPFDIVELYVN